jgi:hypothetical protein
LEVAVITRQVGGVRLADPHELSRSLRRVLRHYAVKVEAVGHAESNYRDVVLMESLRHEGNRKHGSSKRISVALDALVDAVVDLQSAQVEVLALAADQGVALQTAGAPGEPFASADRDFAGYLAARTFDQVREAAERQPARPLVAAAPPGAAPA